MPRVLPSDVVAVADRMFQGAVQNPYAFPNIGPDSIPSLAALARLVNQVPSELVTLDPTGYAGLVASVAYLEALGDAFQSSHTPIALHLRDYDRNHVFLL